jgi:hypothetical protein
LFQSTGTLHEVPDVRRMVVGPAACTDCTGRSSVYEAKTSVKMQRRLVVARSGV